MSTILELFKKSPGIYSEPKQNLTNFDSIPSVGSPRKVDTTPLSVDDTKSIDKRGVYYNSNIYTSGVNYSLLDFTKKTGGEINILSNNTNIGKKVNKGFNKILGLSMFDQVRNNIEQDFNGIRISSGVERNNIQIYGADAIRIATRSTTMLAIMKQNRGQQGRGLLTGTIQTLDKGISSIKGFLGFDEPLNPSNVIRIGSRPRDLIFAYGYKGDEQLIMQKLAEIRYKASGNVIGKLIKNGDKLYYPTNKKIKIKKIMETKKTKEEMDKSKTELLNQLKEMNVSSDNLDWVNEQLKQTITEEVERQNNEPNK